MILYWSQYRVEHSSLANLSHRSTLTDPPNLSDLVPSDEGVDWAHGSNRLLSRAYRGSDVPRSRRSNSGPVPRRSASARRRSARVHARGRITNPVNNFGVKNVDFGGITTPSRAVRSISTTLTGRMSTAAWAVPSATAAKTRSTPCW